jgi:subtilisin family serine protease
MRFNRTIAALGILAVAACDQEPLAPPSADAPLAPPTAASISGGLSFDALNAQPVPRHMVSSRRALSASAIQDIEALGGTVVFTHDIGFSIVDGLSDEAAARLPSIRGVDAVSVDVTIAGEPGQGEGRMEMSGHSPADAFAYRIGLQWHMDAIGAPAAWEAGRLGSSDVTVAIIDSGLDEVHDDLVGRVDASRSRSFLPAGEVDYALSAFFGAPDYADFNGHGTHVGSTVSSNGLVAAGVTDQVTLMAVKACRVDLSCSGSAIIAGILYAADSGADVANMSLGGSFSKSEVAQAGFGDFIGFTNRTFNYASRQGMTIVVSAGNDAVDLDRDGDSYKLYCSTPATICVSATGPAASDNFFFGPFFDINAPAVYTNFGRSGINVAAPGGNVGGLVWAACSSTELDIGPGGFLATPCTFSTNFTSGKAGTSMAAPHVSAVAALLVEEYGRNPSRIENRIQQTADDLGARGTDKFYGKGFINVPQALGIDSSNPANGRGTRVR